MRIRLRTLSLSIFALFTLASCGPKVVFNETHELPGVWSYADSATFYYEVTDTSKRFSLQLTVDHTDAFAKQNMYVEFHTVYPSGGRESQPVSIEMADKFGRWLGDCKGEDCELVLPLQEGARFPMPGSYGLVLKQFGRTDSLDGINAIQLMVIEQV